LLNQSLQLPAGVKVVWTVEPHSKSIFVTTASKEKLFHNEAVENEVIKVDFAQVFG